MEGKGKAVASLKERIGSAQLRAALAVTRELVLLYWQIGRDILGRQKHEGWGTKVIDRLAGDLRRACPDMTGLSPRNLKYMRAFAEAWPEESIVQQLVAQIPWGHTVRLLDHVKNRREREWYAHKTIENGWSRNVLVHWIESDLYEREGKALTKPEYAGKMNFYLSAVDNLLRHPDDKPSIGIILCKTKNEVVAEYALRDLAKPVGVSGYITKLVESLPAALRGSLPSPQQLEAELKKDAAAGIEPITAQGDRVLCVLEVADTVPPLLGAIDPGYPGLQTTSRSVVVSQELDRRSDSSAVRGSLTH